MKIPKLKKFQLIEVDWIDSCHESGWKSENSMDSNDEWLNMKTSGYFLKIKEKSICIIQSLALKERSDGFHVDAMMQIPKCAINKVKILK